MKVETRDARLTLIQYARGIAAMLVVAFHLTALSGEILGHRFLHGVFSFGWVGVDFFFVLSGFIIYWVHGGDLGRWREFPSYFKKRLIRVYPIYLVVTLLVLPIYLLGYGADAKRDPEVIWRSLFLIPQAEPGVYPLVNVAWTLSHEMLFYVLFGLAILLGRQGALALLGAWGGGTLLVLAQEMGGGPGLAEPHLAFLFSRYNLEFLLGCLVAVAARRSLLPRPWWVLGAGGAAFVAAAVNLRLGLFPLESVLAFGLPCAVIVYAAVSIDLQRPVRPSRLGTLLGDASYSIYLTHFTVLTASLLLARRGGLVGLVSAELLCLVTLALTTLVGVWFYMQVERRLLAQCRTWILKTRSTPAPAPEGKLSA